MLAEASTVEQDRRYVRLLLLMLLLMLLLLLLLLLHMLLWTCLSVVLLKLHLSNKERTHTYNRGVS